LLSSFLDNFTILLTDEFGRFNGISLEEVSLGRQKIKDVFTRLDKIYKREVPILCCSDFMQTDEYTQEFLEVQRKVHENKLEHLVLQSVPERKRNDSSALAYPLHEIACVKYLRTVGFSLKVGPSEEKVYDNIIKKIGVSIDFAYLLDAYAAATREPEPVLHYVPTSRGPNNGQRLFFGDEEHKVKTKLKMSCDEALRYFCKVGSISGIVLGQEYLPQHEIEKLYGKALRRKAIQLVIENIVQPYQEVL